MKKLRYLIPVCLCAVLFFSCPGINSPQFDHLNIKLEPKTIVATKPFSVIITAKDQFGDDFTPGEDKEWSVSLDFSASDAELEGTTSLAFDGTGSSLTFEELTFDEVEEDIVLTVSLMNKRDKVIFSKEYDTSISIQDAPQFSFMQIEVLDDTLYETQKFDVEITAMDQYGEPITPPSSNLEVELTSNTTGLGGQTLMDIDAKTITFKDLSFTSPGTYVDIYLKGEVNVPGEDDISGQSSTFKLMKAYNFTTAEGFTTTGTTNNWSDLASTNIMFQKGSVPPTIQSDPVEKGTRGECAMLGLLGREDGVKTSSLICAANIPTAPGANNVWTLNFDFYFPIVDVRSGDCVFRVYIDGTMLFSFKLTDTEYYFSHDKWLNLYTDLGKTIVYDQSETNIHEIRFELNNQSTVTSSKIYIDNVRVQAVAAP